MWPASLSCDDGGATDDGSAAGCDITRSFTGCEYVVDCPADTVPASCCLMSFWLGGDVAEVEVSLVASCSGELSTHLPRVCCGEGFVGTLPALVGGEGPAAELVEALPLPLPYVSLLSQALMDCGEVLAVTLLLLCEGDCGLCAEVLACPSFRWYGCTTSKGLAFLASECVEGSLRDDSAAAVLRRSRMTWYVCECNTQCMHVCEVNFGPDSLVYCSCMYTHTPKFMVLFKHMIACACTTITIMQRIFFAVTYNHQSLQVRQCEIKQSRAETRTLHNSCVVGSVSA